MFINLARQSPASIRKVRFTLGVLTSIILAFTFNWAFSFITPIFVAKFLGNTKPKLAMKAYVAILVIIAAAFIFGLLLTKLFLPFPLVFIIILTLTIFWVSLWSNNGGNELAVTMVLVAVTLIPMLTLMHQQVASSFIIGFLISCLVALFITMVMHELVPDKEQTEESPSEDKALDTSDMEKVRMALLSTIIIIPVVSVFFFFDFNSSVIILVFIVLLAQQPELFIGVQGSKALLIGNTIGGLIAMLIYSLLIIAPNLTFLILLSALMISIFANIIFSTHKAAPLFAIALSTVIILISMASLSETDVNEKFYIRIAQIGTACFYIIFATVLTYPILQRIKSSQPIINKS